MCLHRSTHLKLTSAVQIKYLLNRIIPQTSTQYQINFLLKKEKEFRQTIIFTLKVLRKSKLKPK